LGGSASAEQFADGYAQAVTFGMLMARAKNISMAQGLDRTGQELGPTRIGTAVPVRACPTRGPRRTGNTGPAPSAALPRLSGLPQRSACRCARGRCASRARKRTEGRSPPHGCRNRRARARPASATLPAPT